MRGDEVTEYFRESFGLTAREVEIVHSVIGSRSYQGIADELFISYKTVDNHIQSVYRKTGVKSKLQLMNLIRANRALR